MDKFSLSLCLSACLSNVSVLPFLITITKNWKHHLFFSSHDLVLVPKVTMIIMMILLMRQKLPLLKEALHGNVELTHAYNYICDQLGVWIKTKSQVHVCSDMCTGFLLPCTHRWSCLFFGVVFRHDCVVSPFFCRRRPILSVCAFLSIR